PERYKGLVHKNNNLVKALRGVVYYPDVLANLLVRKAQRVYVTLNFLKSWIHLSPPSASSPGPRPRRRKHTKALHQRQEKFRRNCSFCNAKITGLPEEDLTSVVDSQNCLAV